MPLFSQLKPDTYLDSVRLMKISDNLSTFEGVAGGSVAMGTDANKTLFRDKNLLSDDLAEATPGDLMIAVEADDESLAKQAFQQIESMMSATGEQNGDGTNVQRTPVLLERALDRQPDSNLALISVPGEYAWLEAKKALNRNMHVLLFSDNVPEEREIQLKQHARDRGLLLMGPDAGTSIINGVPLGFANQVRSGPVGLVSASGTGLQEVTSLIHRGGSGITHGIGVGGHDLSRDVGGLMMMQGIDHLSRDEDTEVIVLISKPPSKQVANRILDRARSCDEPVIVNFLGLEGNGEDDNLRFARTLQDAAELALRAAGRGAYSFDDDTYRQTLNQLTETGSPDFNPSQRYIRGLFAGGTLCSEAELLLADRLSDVFSNVSPEEQRRLEDPWTSRAHSCVDLGDDTFTRGRAHPMIDPDIREERLMEEAEDPGTAVVILDFPIGYGAHEDPAGAMAPLIQQARQVARERGGELLFLTHVCGTEEDPQDLRTQESTLKEAGAHVFSTNAQAARAAAEVARTLSNSDG